MASSNLENYDNFKPYPYSDAVVGLSQTMMKDEMKTDETAESILIHHKHLEENDVKFYQCGACLDTFAKYLELKAHVKKARRNKTSTTHPSKVTSFNCVKCDRWFSTIAKLNEHVKTHTGEKAYDCPDCSKPFLRKRDMQRHRKIHLYKPVPYEDADLTENEHLEENDFESPLSVVWRNDQMETDEAADSSLTDNEQLQENLDVKYYHCGACDRSFARYWQLKEHVKRARRATMKTSHQRTLTSFRCGKCKRSFSSMANLNAHVIVHIGEKAYECSLCSKRFLRKCDLDRHAKTHLGVKPFQCEVCRKQFTRGHYRAHMRTHTGEKPFECYVCHKCFSRQDILNRHVVSHTVVLKHQCDMCPVEKLFKTKKELERHMVIHGVKRYKCFKDGCEKRFCTRSNRTEHERIHRDIRPHACKYCKKRYVQKSALKYHIRTHTGEKPYTCDLCGQGFAAKSHANVHMKKEKRKPIEKRCDYKGGEHLLNVVA